MIKAVVLTDIHDAYAVARRAVSEEGPGLVLDCGDHDEISNLFGFVPHLYVFGNHAPDVISVPSGGLPFPIHLSAGRIYDFDLYDEHLRVAGLGGNYSKRRPRNAVRLCDVEDLAHIPRGAVDVLLTHESPLNVSQTEYSRSLAPKVLEEIDRIKPKFVFAGHAGFYKIKETPGGVPIVDLEAVEKGYGVLTFDGDFNFERKRSEFSPDRHH